MRNKTFNYEMNILRGIAIFLVVFGHATFKENFTNNISGTSLLQWSVEFIYTFHMPLFFFISGFFAYKLFEIRNINDYYTFVKYKFIKLIIPYLTFSIAGTIIKLLLSSIANNPVNLKYVFIDILLYPWNNPLKLLWFIYTLFIIFMLLPLFNRINNKIKLIILGLLWILPFSYGEIFNFNGVIRYSFWFILGYEFFKTYDKYLKYEHKYKALLAIVSTGLLFIININPIQTGVFINIFEMVCSFLAILSLVNLVHIINIKSKICIFLNALGKYSMDIYLLHWFLQMPIRLLWDKLHFNYYIMFSLALMLAFLSIPISKYIIRKYKFFSYIAYGVDYSKKSEVSSQYIKNVS